MRQKRIMRPVSGAVRQLVGSTALALLLACEPAGQDARDTDTLLPMGAAPTTGTTVTRESPPPLARQLKLDIPPTRLDKLVFMSLSGCAVQATVGKRNSGLGRHAKSSQRLLLALEYLRLAPPCIERLRSNAEDALAAPLQEAWRQTRAQLPALIFNATLASDEYRAFWLPTPAPGEYPRVNSDVATAALDAVTTLVDRWLSGDYRAHNRNFELLLSEVAGGDGGALQRALLTPSEGRAIAEANKSSVHRRYLDQVRPVVALEVQLRTVLPQRYRDWMDDRNRRFTKVTVAPD
jgi:hypothetical protein